MNLPYAFGIRTHHHRVRLDARISIPQLMAAMKAAGWCVSNDAMGDLVIHRMPTFPTVRAAHSPPVGVPPSPETAA